LRGAQARIRLRPGRAVDEADASRGARSTLAGMLLTDELAHALWAVLATAFGVAVGWWVLAPWALSNLRIVSVPESTAQRRGDGGTSAESAGSSAATRSNHELRGVAKAVVAASDPREIAQRDGPGRVRPRTTGAGQSRAMRRPSRRAIRATAAVLTGASWGLLVWVLGPVAALPAVLVFAAAATVLAIVDVLEQRLPNAVVGPAFGAVAVLLAAASAVTGDWIALAWAGLGSAVMFAVYLVAALISPAAMGMGDVKLAGLIGLLLGWFGLEVWLAGLLGGFVLGGLAAIGGLVLRKVTLSGSIPFGPSMLAAALLAVLIS
jgi:leader peptidase (prepilin peptidase)/N-methyltransferase